MPEIRIPFEEIDNSMTITEVQERKFEEHGQNMHRNEVDELIDDHKKKQRILKVRASKKFFFMGK